MIKKTIKEIEDNIKKNVTQEVLNLTRDYVMEVVKSIVETYNGNFTNVKNHLEGIDKIAGKAAIPLPSSATDPVGTADAPLKEFNWYYNTKENSFKMYTKVGKVFKWTLLVNLSDIVPTDRFMEIQELYDTFIAGSFGTLGELYEVENGKPVQDQNIKALNLVEVAELVKDQREIDKNFLADFEDDLYYANPFVIYRDTKTNLPTLKAGITVSGSTFTYSTLIHPYDRINQEQASFEGTFAFGGYIQYLFSSKFKALRFSGTYGDTYKWETFGKFEAGKRVPYIRFTGTATMSISTDPLNPTSFVNQTLPLEMRLSDLMDENNRTAIVSIKWTQPPKDVRKGFLNLKYFTTTNYMDSRITGLFGDMDKRITEIEKDAVITNITASDGGFGNLVLPYKPTERAATMPVGDEIIVNIETKYLPASVTLTDSTPVMLVNQANLGGNPAANMEAMEIVQWKSNDNAADKTNYTYARKWDYFKGMYKDYWVILQKQIDFDGKIIWIPIGWRPKPSQPGDISLGRREVTPVNVWTDFNLAKPGRKLVYINAHNAHDVESHNSAFLKDSNLRFDQDGRAVANVSTGHERQWKLTAGGIEIWEQGVLQTTKAYSEWDKFEFYELYGKAWVNQTAPQRDPDITTWANVGNGHQDQVLGFKADGTPEFKKYFSESDASKIFAAKTFDYSDNHSVLTLNVTSGKRYQIITQKSEAQNTPIGAYNKLLLSIPVGAQDDDQVTYGTDLVWIVKANGDIMSWGEIKDHVTKEDKMIIKHLSNGNWELVGWEKNTTPAVKPTTTAVHKYNTGTVASHIGDILHAMEVGGQVDFYRDVATHHTIGETISVSKSIPSLPWGANEVETLSDGTHIVNSSSGMPGLQKYAADWTEMGSWDGPAPEMHKIYQIDSNDNLVITSGGGTIIFDGKDPKFNTGSTDHNKLGIHLADWKADGAHSFADGKIAIWDATGFQIHDGTTYSVTKGKTSWASIGVSNFKIAVDDWTDIFVIEDNAGTLTNTKSIDSSGAYTNVSNVVDIDAGMDITTLETLPKDFSANHDGRMFIVYDNGMTKAQFLDDKFVKKGIPFNPFTGAAGTTNGYRIVPSFNGENIEYLAGDGKAYVKSISSADSKFTTTEAVLTVDQTSGKVFVINPSGAIEDIGSTSLDNTHTLVVKE